MRLIGVLSSGEVASAEEAADALSALNEMLESWSTERLLVPATVEELFDLVVDQTQYTMGPSANFNTTRPIKIEKAFLREIGASNNTDIPMLIINSDEWGDIVVKAVTSSIPLYVYPERTYPNETLNIWPVPSVANKIGIYSTKILTALAALTTTVAFPPGYYRALKYSLALELAPEYARQIDPNIMRVARESKANIKRVNKTPQYLSSDAALMSPDTAFDWRTGGTT